MFRRAWDRRDTAQRIAGWTMLALFVVLFLGAQFACDAETRARCEERGGEYLAVYRMGVPQGGVCDERGDR